MDHDAEIEKLTRALDAVLALFCDCEEVERRRTSDAEVLASVVGPGRVG